MADHSYTVVVGVSATSKSPTALTWAKALADQNGGRLVAVRAWRPSPPATNPPGESDTSLVHETPDAAARALEADVAEVLGEGHGVETKVVHGSKLKVLLDEAEGADLLVVDAPRALAVGPMFAHRLVYAAPCPVLVMPPSVSGEAEPLRERAGKSLGRRLLEAAGTAGRPGYRLP